MDSGSMNVKTCVAALALLWPPVIGAQNAALAPQPTAIEGATTHVYKSIGDVALRLHVFKPARAEASAQKPVIVFFFGGGWRAGVLSQFVPQARHLADRGMVAIVADYRVFGRHGSTPFEAMADAKSALRWVRAHATELGVDPNRLAAAGGSSGGHLAASTAVFSTFDEPGEDLKVSSKPNALVLFNPALDTSAIQQFGDRGRDGSPFHHLIANIPPTLIMHGKADSTVPYESVDRFCAASKALGNRCELVGYEGAAHGFFNPQNADGKWYRQTLLEADRFLTKLGYLPSPSPTQIQ